KNVVARAFLAWRVSDPLRYLQTVLIREAADARLAAVANSELGAAFGSVPFEALVSTDAEKMHLGPIVDQVQERVRTAAGREYGIGLGGLRIERLAFPRQNEASVFQRMRAERDRIARQVRSEGEKEGLKIRAAADLDRARILAEADRKAAEVRGQ